ncbi:serine/threonine-protein kinase [Nonomuraea sp. NPDC050790]|uniref:serine/threonine-protein kinase n=1 Tax=Nonomuraea sp. NPDC050790 TaxID=3364371 RepID=UPI0037BAFC98
MERLVSNRYRLIEPIGEGGMGVVWRAHDELLDRPVAVKEVRYSGVGEAKRNELNRRTIREARAAGRLEHPSVVVVYDVVEEDGRPWIVMNLVRSRSLARVVADGGPLPPGRVAAIGAALLDALRTAHAAGVLHRDVKPENVLLADDGRVVLTDFGIATLEAEQGLTATGNLVGTPAYMPPERLNGLPAGPESDLWALGATLYTAVEGRAPFRGDSWAATVAAVLRDPPAPTGRAGALAPVIEGLLRRDPAARIPAAQAAALLGAASGTAPPPGAAVPHDHAPHEAGRHKRGHHEPGHHEPGHHAHSRHELSRHDTFRDGPGPTGESRARRRPRWILASTALVAVGGLATAGILLSDRLIGAAAPNPTPSPKPSQTTATATATPKPTPTLPEGWRSVTSRAGRFSLAVPKDWKGAKSQDRDSISWTGPGPGGQLIVEWTDDIWSDPVQHWKNVEGDILRREEFRDYRRIAIRRLTYLGRPAADWEFTRAKGGTKVHVITRGFRAADGRPYAVYWELPDSRWKAHVNYFNTFVEYFRVL